MKSYSPPQHAHTIFCDDIRYELSNKRSLIGIYNGVLILDRAPPLLFPKLVAFITYSQPATEDPKDLTIRLIFRDGDKSEEDATVLAEASVPAAAISQVEKIPDLPLDRQQRTLSCEVVISPFAIASEGLLSVRVITGDAILRAGSLKITVAAQRNDAPVT